MSLVSATRSTQLLNCTSAIVLELQEKTIQYSHQSRLQTGELHELLRKPMNIHHVLQTCTMITGGGGIPPLPAHAQTVDTRPYLFSSIGLGTRLYATVRSLSSMSDQSTAAYPLRVTSIALYPDLASSVTRRTWPLTSELGARYPLSGRGARTTRNSFMIARKSLSAQLGRIVLIIVHPV